ASNTWARYRPDFVYSGSIEMIVWGIPILVILFLGGVIWIGSHDLDPYKPISSPEKPVEMQVVSLVVPAGVPVHSSLTSASVMNMFFVPQLGTMIATMNGMVTQLHLAADKPGEFYGQSAQYSGGGFSNMNFTVRAVPQDAFAQWVDGARQSGSALDRTSYLALCQQSSNVRPFTYRSVEFQTTARRHGTK